MKRILLFFALLLTISAVSCDKPTNPAEQFAKELDKLTAQAKSIETRDDYGKLQQGMEQANAIVTENASYRLTDDDKAKLKESMSAFMRVAQTKSFVLQGLEVSDAQIDVMIQYACAAINRFETLGAFHPVVGDAENNTNTNE